jgi:hypothetical protein
MAKKKKMPKVKTASVTYERKVNLGNFSSMTLGVTFWADFDPDEELSEGMHQLWNAARANVQAQTFRILKSENDQGKDLGLTAVTEPEPTEAKGPAEPGDTPY